MAKCLQSWTVYPHGPIEKLEENLWRVEAPLPGAPIKRVLTVARLKDGRLVVHNAIALGEAEMKELEAWGTPSVLVVPNGSHRLDSKIWKDRYPAMTVIAPEKSKKKVEECVKVDETEGHFGDETVVFKALEGTVDGVLEVHSKSGVTLVLNDSLMNSRREPGFKSFMLGAVMGFAGPEPKIPPLAKMFVYKDKPAARAHLERLAATPNLKRVIVSHGQMITDAPGEAIKKACAQYLG